MSVVFTQPDPTEVLKLDPSTVFQNTASNGPSFEPSAEGRKFLGYLNQFERPQAALEMITPVVTSQSEITERRKSVEKAEAVAKAFGIEEFSDLETLPEQAKDAIRNRDRAALPESKAAKDLFDVFEGIDENHIDLAFEYTLETDDYPKKKLERMLASSIKEKAENEETRRTEWIEEASARQEMGLKVDPNKIPEDFGADPYRDVEISALKFALRDDVRNAVNRFNRWKPQNTSTGDYESLRDAQKDRQILTAIEQNPDLRKKFGKALGNVDDLAWNWLEKQTTKEEDRKWDAWIKRQERGDSKVSLNSLLPSNERFQKIEGRQDDYNLKRAASLKVAIAANAILDAAGKEKMGVSPVTQEYEPQVHFPGKHYGIIRYSEEPVLAINAADGRGEILRFEMESGNITSNLETKDFQRFYSVIQAAKESNRGRKAAQLDL